MKIKKSLLFIFFTLFLTACSSSDNNDNKTAKENTSKPATKTISDELVNAKVSEADKDKFEKSFAEQCVQRELRHSTNPESDQVRLTQTCNCVADYLVKNLTAIEAEKFLVEHQDAQSIKIKYENAAFHCLQSKMPPADAGFIKLSK